jgi:hypothetical protein
MANDVQIDVKINGLGQASIAVKDLSKALDDFKGPSKKVQDNIKDVEGSLNSLATKGFGNLAKVAVGAFGTFAALFAGREIIQSAIDDEKSINDLNITLANLGIYSKQTSEEMQKFTDQIQKTTIYSDDQATSVINLLGAMTKLDSEGLKKATQASLDLASTFKIDTETAARAVGKAIDGNYEALKRYRIEVKPAATESERLANTMEALAKFAGRSQADLSTFGGALSFLKNGFDSVLESIGKVVVQDPLIAGLIKTIGEGFFKLGETIKDAGFSITDSFIKILDALISWGVSFQTIATSVIVPATIAIGVAFYNMFNLVKVQAGIATAAMVTFQTVITGGLYLAIAGLTFFFVKSAEEFGGWGNLFKAMGLQIAIWAKNVQIKFVEVQLYFAELSNSIGQTISSVSDKFNKLLGIETPKVEVDTSNVDAYNKKINSLNNEVDNLGNNIVKLGKASEENKEKDPFKSMRDSLVVMRAKFEETKESIKNGGKLGSESLIDTKKVISDFQALYKELDGLQQGDLGRAKAVYEQKIKIITDYQSTIRTTDKNREQEVKSSNEALLNLAIGFEKQKADIEKKAEEERIKKRTEQVNAAKSDPLGTLAGIDKKVTKEIDFVITPKVQGLVEGFGEVFSKGAEGARSMLVGATAGAIDTILPGVGSALKPFIDVFSQGAEQTEKMVTEFLGAIPTFVTNVLTAIPAFFSAIVREVPKVVNKIISEIPKVITSFLNSIPIILKEFLNSIPVLINALMVELPTVINSLALQMPFIAFELISSLVKSVPYLVESMAKALYNGIIQLFNNLVGSVGSVFGFAEGGKIVKGGIQGKDSVPIAVMPGELVADRSLTRQMQNFFDNNPNASSGGGGGNDVTNALLAQILNLLGQPQEVSTSVQFNNKTLADIFINLNRVNARLV